MKKPVIFTIGHSTRPVDEFVRLLKAHEIQAVADVRTIPKSRHNPQYNEVDLKESLRKASIRYRHVPKLGGRRRTTKDSINLGWRNASFRGYADYMAAPEFEAGLEELLKIARTKNTAVMCAEALPWRCHRSLIADALIKKGWLVRDIMSRSSATKHRLTPFLKVREGRLIYPALKA